ncbi:MAG: porin family protein [Gammaproteobacteria bacterium]|nr:porin family protein [Gammaproteobacteria bacterium]MYF37312.1 porin family protein [Gammaproteobacteria bacterium]
MKIRNACIVLIGMLAIPLAAEDNDLGWYFLGGFTVFPDGTSIEVASTEGYGKRWGAGFQINSFFGLEFARDSAPALNDAAIVKIFEQDFDDTINTYDIKSSYNRFSSIVGKFTVPVIKSANLIGKLGYANYSYRSKVEFQSKSELQFSGKFEEDYGLTPTASLGVEFPFRKGFGPSAGIELAVTKVFEEEVESVWGTASFLIRF